MKFIPLKILYLFLIITSLNSTILEASTLTNNYQTAANNLIFYNSLGPLTSYDTVNSGQSEPIPGGALYARATQIGSTFYIPLSSSSSQYFFGTGSITNYYGQSVIVEYWGTLISGIEPIGNFTLANGDVLPIISGAVAVSIYNATTQETIVYYQTISANTAYNLNNTGTLTTTGSDPQLMNNSSQASGIIYYCDYVNSVLTTLGSTSLSAWQATSSTIPAGTSVFDASEYPGFAGPVLMPWLNTNSSQNIFSNYAIFNNSSDEVGVVFYGTLNEINPSQLTSLGLASQESMLITTGTTGILLYPPNAPATPIQTISLSSSYQITNNPSEDPAWTLTEYTPTVINNNGLGQSASSFSFYDGNNNIISTSSATVADGGSINIPSYAGYIAFLESGINSTLSIPTTPAPSSNAFTGSIISNNYGSTVYIEFYGTINGVNDRALNSPAIVLTNMNFINIISGASSFSIFSSADTSQTPIATSTIIPSVNYIINPGSNPISFINFTNNYSQNATNLIFKNSSNVQVGTTISPWNAWTSSAIPTTATTASFTEPAPLSTQFIIPISDTTQCNLFTNYALYNNYTNTIQVTFFATVNGIANTPLNTTPISVAPLNSIPIPTNPLDLQNNTLTVTISGGLSPITQQSISASSYIFNSNGQTLTQYIPTLFNNYGLSGVTNLYFYNGNNQVIAGPNTLNPNGSLPTYPNANYIQLNETSLSNSLITLAPCALLTSNIFSVNSTTSPITNYTVSNASNQTITVSFFGNVNGNPNAQLNTPISIPANGVIPTITGATSITASSSSGTILLNGQTQPTISTNASYFITYNSSTQTWSLSSSIPLSSATLTNNLNQAATNFNFYNSINYPINASNSSIPAQSFTTIPQTATSAIFTNIFNNVTSTITLPISSSSSSNIFTTNVVYNNSSGTINIVYIVNSTTELSLNTPISIAPGQGIPIITGANYANVYDSQLNLILSNQTINPNTSYNVNNSGSSLSFTASQPALVSNLFNNNTSSQTATNLTFYNIANVPISSTTPTILAGGSVPITSGAAYAQVTEFGTQLQIPIAQTSNNQYFFGTGFLTNNYGANVTVQYFTTVNGISQWVSQSTIAIAQGGQIPIVTGTTLVNVYNQSSNQTIVLNAGITANTNYTINSTGTITTTASEPQLINNNSQASGTIHYVNSSFATLGSTSLSAWQATSVTIPADTVAFNAISYPEFSDGILIPWLNISNSQNIFTNYAIFNNTSLEVSVNFYGSVNIPSLTPPVLLGTINLASGGYSLILTGTTQISIQSGSTIVTTSNFSTTSSYEITDDPSLAISTYQPTIVNNNGLGQSATEIAFYNGNSTLIATSSTPLADGGSINFPAYTGYITCLESGINSVLSIPTTPVPSSNIFSEHLITNNYGSTLYVVFYGKINGTTNTPLNSPAITIANTASINIMAQASSFAIFSSTNTTQTPISSQNISMNTDYNITNGSDPITSATYQITNNYNQTATNLIFKNSSNVQVGTTISTWNSWTGESIPTYATTASFTEPSPLSTNFIIPISDTESIDIFTTYGLYNNYDQNISVTFLGTVNGIANTPLNSPAITMSGKATIPIPYNTNKITIADNKGTFTFSILNSYSYIFSNNGEDLNYYVPTLYNNYSLSNVTNLNFNNENNQTIQGPFTIAPNGSTTVDITANYMQFNQVNLNNSIFTLPVYSTQSSNIFTVNSNTSPATNYTITNISNQTIYVSFFGSVDGENDTQLNTPISIGANLSIPIIWGAEALSLTLSSQGAPVLINDDTQTSLTSDTSYFISYNAVSNEWSVTTSIPASNATLTNNSNQSANNLNFYNSSNYAINSSAITLPAQNSTQSTGQSNVISIPDTSTTVQFSQNFTTTTSSVTSTITLPISTTVSSSLFSTNLVYNNTASPAQTINIIFYGTINNATEQPFNSFIPIVAGQATAILYNALYANVYDSNGNILLNMQPITPNTTYYVNYDGTTWSWTNYLPTPPSNFTNNSTQNATNLIFKNSSNVQVGTTISPWNASTSSAIPTTATTAQLNNFGTFLTLPIVDTVTSNLVTNMNIINNSGNTIQVNYYGTLNGLTSQLFNSTPISIADSASSPILTGATIFQVIGFNAQTIEAQTSYTIYNNDIVPETAAPSLWNNSGQNISDLQFYNGATPIGSPSQCNNQTTINIPSNATNATMTLSFDNSNSVVTLPINSLASSNIVTSDISDGTNYTITNTTSNQIGIIFSNTATNTPAILIAPGDSVPIITSAGNVSIFDSNNTQQIANAPIAASTDYYVNEVNNIWSFTTYSSYANLTNNYYLQATDLQFFYSNFEPIDTIQPTFAAWGIAPIPSEAAVIEVNETINNVLTPLMFFIDGFNNANIFTENVINNNTDQDISLNFLSNEFVNINSAPLSLPANGSIRILSGTTYVTVFGSIDEQPINLNTSYYLTEIDGVWSLNAYTETSLLNNNYNLSIQNLIFYDGLPTTKPTSAPKTVNAYGTSGIPINTTYAQFTDFNNVTMTIPVSDNSSSQIFVTSTINNLSTETIGITFYGTMNDAPNGPINSSLILADPNTSIPIPTNTTSLTITVNNVVVLNTTTISGLNPLPLNVSYNITYESNVWFIFGTDFQLTNNFNQPVITLAYTDAAGNPIASSYTSIASYASVPIPTNAAVAQVSYENVSLHVPLSENYPSKIFTNGTIFNNSTQSIEINYYTTLNGINNVLLNTTPITIEAGNSLPIISYTSNISITQNETSLLSHQSISANGSYRITNAATYSGTKNPLLKDGTAYSIKPSASSLGIVRFIGGSESTGTLPGSTPEITHYGYNQSLFSQFLYVDTYSTVITDPQARKATVLATNSTLQAYGASYQNQADFNYINYLYLIQPDLDALASTLALSHPNSANQIALFFDYLEERFVTLLE